MKLAYSFRLLLCLMCVPRTAQLLTRADTGCLLCSGYLSVWELFSSDIQNFTAYAPFMIIDGNHERDYPQSGAPGQP